MDNNLPDFISSICKSGFLEIDGEQIKVKGFSNVNNLIFLKNIIYERNIRRTLEIGLAYGGSATIILHSLKKKLSKGFSHTAIDPYQSSWIKNYGVKQIKKLGLSDYFKLIENFSEFALPQMLLKKDKFDLIYIDGSHQFDNVFLDAYYSFRILNKNGILIFDDAADKGVLKAINYLVKSNPTSLKKIDVRNYLKFSPLKNVIYPFASRIGKVQLQVFEKITETNHIWGK